MSGYRGELLDLLDGVLYADAFDCAPTVDEVRRWSRVAVSGEQLHTTLRDDPDAHTLVIERDGLVALREREELLARRPAQLRRARRLRARARRVARVLRHLPFVRGLALSGSLAADDASAEADVDLLVVVAHGRIGTVFAVLGTLSRVLGRRLLCPNHYVSERGLVLDVRSVYVAREVAQLVPLAGAATAVHEANGWTADFFPNARTAGPLERCLAGGGRLQGLLERPLRGRTGDRVEEAAGRLARARLSAHHARFSSPVPAAVAADLDAGIALRFHGADVAPRALSRYEQHRAGLAVRTE